MKKIFVDLEMNPIRDKAARRICRSETIEIGAIMLDESNQEISSFKSYVQPTVTPRVSQKITDLTGITTNKLAGAEHFDVVIEQFAAWCVQSGNDFQVFAWSDSDLLQILEELTLKKINPSRTLEQVMGQWTNYQAEYDELIGVNPIKPTSLAHALIYSGIPFTGKMHDALYDARNTARLYIETLDGEHYLKMVFLASGILLRVRSALCR